MATALLLFPAAGPATSAGAATYLTSACLAYGLATILCLGNALDYLPGSGMRRAWMALAGAASLSIFRYPFELSPRVFNLGSHARLIGFMLILFAWLSLLYGLCAMCRALFQLGLGFELKRSDMAGVVAIFVSLSTILLFNRFLSEAHSPQQVLFYMQLATHVLLAATAAVAIVLHRLTVEMGGGKLAGAIRCIIFHVVLRAAIALLPIALHLVAPHQDSRPIVDWCMLAPPWIFAIAAASRSQIVSATRHEIRGIAYSSHS